VDHGDEMFFVEAPPLLCLLSPRMHLNANTTAKELSEPYYRTPEVLLREILITVLTHLPMLHLTRHTHKTSLETVLQPVVQKLSRPPKLLIRTKVGH
jgi:hypothetical protein